jgi:hypothetical protein
VLEAGPVNRSRAGTQASGDEAVPHVDHVKGDQPAENGVREQTEDHGVDQPMNQMKEKADH